MAKTTIVNIRNSAYDIYIGRGSKWGNPYKIGATQQDSTKSSSHKMTRKESIERYKQYLLNGTGRNFNGETLLDQLHELKGKVLGCYCKPLACHGDILAELADAELANAQ